MGALGAEPVNRARAALAALVLVSCASATSSPGLREEDPARAQPVVPATGSVAGAAVAILGAPRKLSVEKSPSSCAIARDLEAPEQPALSAQREPSRANLRAWVETLAHPALRGREAGTPDARRAARLISEYLASLGADAPSGGDRCLPFSEAGLRDQNVVAHLPHASTALPPSCRWIVVGAHYDALGVDPRGRIRPGADDNATGVAVVLELARLVKSGARRPRTGLVLAAFGAEEKDLTGSRAYVAAPSVPLEEVALMINVDMAGRRPANIPSIGYEASGPERRTTAALVRRAAERSKVGAIAMLLGDRSDSASFSQRVPTLFFSTTVHADYHQPSDTPERVDYAQVERALSLVLDIVEHHPCEPTSRAAPAAP
jgi:hypothetical protein